MPLDVVSLEITRGEVDGSPLQLALTPASRPLLQLTLTPTSGTSLETRITVVGCEQCSAASAAAAPAAPAAPSKASAKGAGATSPTTGARCRTALRVVPAGPSSVALDLSGLLDPPAEEASAAPASPPSTSSLEVAALRVADACRERLGSSAPVLLGAAVAAAAALVIVWRARR